MVKHLHAKMVIELTKNDFIALKIIVFLPKGSVMFMYFVSQKPYRNIMFKKETVKGVVNYTVGHIALV